MGEAETGTSAVEGSAADADSGAETASSGSGGEQPMDLSVGGRGGGGGGGGCGAVGRRRRSVRAVPGLIPLSVVRRAQRQLADPRALLYTHLLHHFHAQEMLRRQLAMEAALMAMQEAPRTHPAEDAVAPEASAKCVVDSGGSSDADTKRRRPLTGKHVRHGTGASPATLLTLRKKIEARQRRLALSS